MIAILGVQSAGFALFYGIENSCTLKRTGGSMKMQKNSKMVHYEVIQNCLVIYISNDLDHHTVTLLRDYSDRLIDA